MGKRRRSCVDLCVGASHDEHEGEVLDDRKVVEDEVFSTAAVGAVAAVSITGIALAIAILGNVGDLFSTDFGRLLVVKSALVGVLVLLGAYNHLVLGPALERPRAARAATHRLRTIATAEVALFLAVITLTAFLVGADST